MWLFKRKSVILCIVWVSICCHCLILLANFSAMIISESIVIQVVLCKSTRHCVQKILWFLFKIRIGKSNVSWCCELIKVWKVFVINDWISSWVKVIGVLRLGHTRLLLMDSWGLKCPLIFYHYSNLNFQKN